MTRVSFSNFLSNFRFKVNISLALELPEKKVLKLRVLRNLYLIPTDSLYFTIALTGVLLTHKFCVIPSNNSYLGHRLSCFLLLHQLTFGQLQIQRRFVEFQNVPYRANDISHVLVH